MHFLPYNKTLKEYSRELRSHSTLSDLDVKKNMPYILAEIGYFIDDWEKENGVLPTSF